MDADASSVVFRARAAWRRSRRRCRARAATLLLAACAASAGAQTTLRLARLENIPDQAVGAEILEAVYRRVGIAVEFVDLPAKRALIESSQGRVDGEVHRILAVGSEYPTLIAVQPSINFIEPAAFVKQLDFRVDGWASIAPYAIGIVRGVGSSERGTRGARRVEAVGTMDQLMQMLDAGRIEVAVNDRFSGVLVNRRLRLEAIRPLSPALERIALYHFLHERHRALVPRVAQALQAMQDSGELERLREQITERMLQEAAR